MRCDKCGKKFENDWVPDALWPEYDIVQKLGVIGHISNIYLCSECSKKFKDWLEAGGKENGADK